MSLMAFVLRARSGVSHEDPMSVRTGGWGMRVTGALQIGLKSTETDCLAHSQCNSRDMLKDKATHQRSMTHVAIRGLRGDGLSVLVFFKVIGRSIYCCSRCNTNPV